MLINSFWHGERLSLLEQLTLQSFIDHGHEFCLWTYNKNIKNKIPEEVMLEDANKILDYSKFFVYEGNGDCGRGTIGGFSDIFRYYLLLKNEGWYVDMDVTCLKPFNELNAKIILRPHNKHEVVSNIIKFKDNEYVISNIIKETEKYINKNNDKWVLPLEIFKKHIFENKLNHYIVSKTMFGDDSPNEIDSYLKQNMYLKRLNVPEYAIHWCNTSISSGRWNGGKYFYNKNNPTKFTLYEHLLKRHRIIK